MTAGNGAGWYTSPGSTDKDPAHYYQGASAMALCGTAASKGIVWDVALHIGRVHLCEGCMGLINKMDMSETCTCGSTTYRAKVVLGKIVSGSGERVHAKGCPAGRADRRRAGEARAARGKS